MGTTITLTLPEAVYRQAQAVANEAHRSLPDVLADALTQAFPTVYVSADRRRMQQEQRAYERLREGLLSRYEGQFVAVHGGQVVDHDADEVALVGRVAIRFPGQVLHIRLVAREPEAELRVRSPRLAD